MVDNTATLTDMAHVRWKLDDYLKRHDITVYRLGKRLGGQTKMPNLYRITRGDTRRVDLDSLGEIIGALRDLTGEDVTLSDLLEVSP